MIKTVPTVSIIQWNAKSLYRSKLDLFKGNLRSLNPAIVLLSETQSVDFHPVLFDSFNCFTRKRANQNCGGVAFLTEKSLSAHLVSNTPTLSHIEYVYVSLYLSKFPH